MSALLLLFKRILLNFLIKVNVRKFTDMKCTLYYSYNPDYFIGWNFRIFSLKF